MVAAQQTAWKTGKESLQCTRGNNETQYPVLGKQYWSHISSTGREFFLYGLLSLENGL